MKIEGLVVLRKVEEGDRLETIAAAVPVGKILRMICKDEELKMVARVWRERGVDDEARRRCWTTVETISALRMATCAQGGTQRARCGGTRGSKVVRGL